MKFKKTKTAALALATLFVAGSFSGCAFVTSNIKKDLEQVIATVDITKSSKTDTGLNPEAAENIEPSDILKRDLVANYASYGSTYVNSYGMTVEATYDLIKNNLVNRQIYLQFAQSYFLDHEEGKTKEGWDAAIASASEQDKPIAGLSYFLDQDEIDKAEYDLKVMFNSTLDAHELEYIETEEDEHDHDTARTTPTGMGTETEDYYNPAYQIYTGYNAAADCPGYEVQDGSTPATRVKAYKALLSNLNYYGLVTRGENTSDITALEYYTIERKSQYETQLINKLSEVFEEEAKAKITEQWLNNKFDTTLQSQKEQFGVSDASALESALDGVGDSSFVFYAPEGYGFVINILLPFSTSQTQELNDSPADFGDAKGNKFVKRAGLLQALTATDQRNTWFSGHEDYSYEAVEADKAYTAGDPDRKFLFFEDNMKKTEAEGDLPAQYEKIPNYLGKYTYNGKVMSTEDEDGDKKFAFRPNKITIDGFLDELSGYLKQEGYTLTPVEGKPNKPADYYTKPVSSYYKDNAVDYSSFLYYEAKVDELADFDVNKIFLPGSDENNVMSIINELSFAYNTDTAGLNTYLGYAVSPNNTDFVKEFEYAAQEAVRGGAGTITVAPSDYGWHIMYCTFSYSDGTTPFHFSWADRDTKGTFSNLYYEALTAKNFSGYSSEVQTRTLNDFNSDECVTVFVDRYKDLYED